MLSGRAVEGERGGLGGASGLENRVRRHTKAAITFAHVVAPHCRVDRDLSMMTADNGALEPCSICLELTVEWLARRGSCCGELTCRPCRATLEKTPVPGGSGRMQSESCPVCRQSLPRTQAELVKRLRERAALGHAGAQAELGEAMV